MNWKSTIFLAVVVCLCANLAIQAQIPDPENPDPNDPNTSMTLLLWLDAGVGVMAESPEPNDPNFVPAASDDVVMLWKDRSHSGNDATRVKGSMFLSSYDFDKTEGGVNILPVVTFNKDGFFKLNTAPLRVPELSVYAVVEQTQAERRVYFSTYSNDVQWGHGVNLDMEGGSTRVFTSGGTQGNISDWTMPGPAAGMHILTALISFPLNSKRVYSDGLPLGGPVPVPGLSYYGGETASVGALGQLDIDYFFFRGNIAELIVYDSADETLREIVETYLFEKYQPTLECSDWGYYQQDLNQDCYVNLADFAIFVQRWLQCTDPQGEGCDNLINP